MMEGCPMMEGGGMMMIGMVLVWLLTIVALLLAIQWFTSRPRTVVVLPVVVALMWLATVLGGAAWLGWGVAGG